MSDRGVLAHMHKAILELDKRLEAIEEKLKWYGCLYWWKCKF
jgi:hypothetical protein